MAERSLFWTSNGTGDGIALAASQFSEWLRASFTNDKYATEGVVAGVGGQFAVTGTSSPLTIGTGVAYVNGYYYQSTSTGSAVIPTPTTGTTGHRIVIRASTTAQTVRLDLKSSNDGTSSPPAVQQDSQVWEVSVATISITTAGVITITDARDYCHISPALLYRRLGNSSTDFSTAGGSSYNPGAVRVQTGVNTLVFDSDDDSDTKTITFPQSYTGKPLIFVSTYNNAVSNANRVLTTVYRQGTSSFTVRGRRVDTSWSQSVPFTWMAVGPK